MMKQVVTYTRYGLSRTVTHFSEGRRFRLSISPTVNLRKLVIRKVVDSIV